MDATETKKICNEIAAKSDYKMDDLLTIMKILRSADGCPWDREQNHKSIRNNFIEETYEAVEAIDTCDSELLREELGDVLLQVVFHSQISSEDGDFSFTDVINGICAKLVMRHPHIFADTVVKNTGEVLVNWDNIKQTSKGRETLREKLEGVSKALPALMRAGKLAHKAVSAGIKPEFGGGAALGTLFDGANGGQELEAKIGNLLFAAAAEAEARGINAEKALYDSCERFIDRC